MIPYELPVFRGHFPSTPIVPGVVQVGWAVDLARAHGLASGPFAGISQAKFRRLVQPGMTLEARLEHDPAAGQLCFRYSLASTVVSTGRVQFRSTNA
jgi:3-hydroxymyristoyl/3-hydroxydecanoyl-(acyl carrier protein) dehydratase